MKILGIDPGKRGVALQLSGEVCEYIKLRFDQQNLLDTNHFISFILSCSPDLIIMEKVQAVHRWSCSANFVFGGVFYQLLLSLKHLRRPYRLVNPYDWQAVVHQGIEKKKEAKVRSLIAYERLYPHKPIPLGPRAKVPHDGIMDALLIATHGKLTYDKDKIIKQIIMTEK